jgi:hypothetical protein
MPEVNGRTLMLAIQAVNAKIQALNDALAAAAESDDDDAAADAEELLMSYEAAADELRTAYEIARLAVSNLPPYATLVGGD